MGRSEGAVGFDDSGWVKTCYGLESVDVLGKDSTENVVAFEEEEEVMCWCRLQEDQPQPVKTSFDDVR